ncbi:MAG: amidophosphoribosyltransferase [Rhodospirillaceae bacterium]|nr:amidophosphoribosyltransferase [Rhodospirillaceae bacterium]MBT4427748.1 amidophosphoribosyltransferase [Rhodospirillaceae bacterium]MBT5040503.1 amidophosphoribosyltransferase [Rhodospirillaceae bacterium]MBT5675631.1 amidophosphoribosyltransferase [Rhodospirillaceae bacterium]MBT5781041.1 amidophosphoribosyltransferase [Rhodospirillaceae bacterium]
MCGIVGLFLKNPELDNSLGHLLTPMLVEMTERGPDSAGFAVYGPQPPQARLKYTLSGADGACDWPSLAADLEQLLETEVEYFVRANHAVFILPAQEAQLREFIAAHHPDLHITAIGSQLEIYKDTGLPAGVAARFGLDGMIGSHAIGHTRMATESGISGKHSHPFCSGRDFSLVHNGSLSNHNGVRDKLRHEGVTFDSDNDTEVAARYIAHRLGRGRSLNDALQDALMELDGFYTFAIGSADGFAVLRDSIAAKPAVLAETGDWVAMASEYRALAALPGIEQARIWEPKPATVYSWSHERMARAA